MNVPIAVAVPEMSEEVRAALALLVLEFQQLLERHRITPVLTDEDFLVLCDALLAVVLKLTPARGS